MSVQVFERASASFAAGPAKRGHPNFFRAKFPKQLSRGGRSQWYIGRVSAECGFCATAVPLAEAQWQEASPRAFATASRNVAPSADQRRFERTPANGRKLQLLIDGSPTSFALHNISDGGVM